MYLQTCTLEDNKDNLVIIGFILHKFNIHLYYFNIVSLYYLYSKSAVENTHACSTIINDSENIEDDVETFDFTTSFLRDRFFERRISSLTH